MSARSKGDGSVYQSQDGRGWIASVELPEDGSGRRVRRKRRARTKTEAKRLLRTMRLELAQFGDLGDGNRLVRSAVEDHLQVRRAKKLAPRTQAKDERAAVMITQGLGELRVTKLSVLDCDRFLADAAAGRFGDPLANEQLRRLRRKLIDVIANDQRRGLVTRNVAELSEVPAESAEIKRRREPRAIQYEALLQLLDAADGVIEVLIDLSGRNGLRPAEARGLRWSRVDLDAATIRIDTQMNRLNELAAPKTKRSRRTIRIDARSATLLRNWHQAQLEVESEGRWTWQGNDEGLVATTRNGTALFQRNVHRSLVQASERAGLLPHVSAYDLRHTAITLQVEKGHPIEKIADWAGTSERMIWDVYRHKLELVTDLGSLSDREPRKDNDGTSGSEVG